MPELPEVERARALIARKALGRRIERVDDADTWCAGGTRRARSPTPSRARPFCRPTFDDGGRLALRDKRRLGRAVLDPDLSTLDPDAAEVSRTAFRERVGRGSTSLKARIMDQSVIAGVGNLLADETLWRTGLSPLLQADDLDEQQLDHLWAHHLLVPARPAEPVAAEN